MAKAKLKFRLHRTVIVLISLALLVVLMQGASWFSLGHQMARSEQVEELAHTLTRQVAWSLTPLMDNSDDNHQKIVDTLDQLTHDSRILDASVYDDEGTLLAHSGESINVRDRLALDGQRAGSYFNHQIVQPLASKEGPRGFLRVTLDTHVLVTESRQVDNTTNILRLMLLLALAIGIILTRTLLRDRRTRWQQSPFLLTANNPVREDDEEEPDNANQGSGLTIRIHDGDPQDAPPEEASSPSISAGSGGNKESIGAILNKEGNNAISFDGVAKRDSGNDDSAKGRDDEANKGHGGHKD